MSAYTPEEKVKLARNPERPGTADFIQALGPCLTGAPYQPQALADAVSQLPGPLAQELAQWLQAQTL